MSPALSVPSPCPLARPPNFELSSSPRRLLPSLVLARDAEITIVKGKLEDTVLPVKQVDIIISEVRQRPSARPSSAVRVFCSELISLLLCLLRHSVDGLLPVSPLPPRTDVSTPARSSRV